MGSVEYDYWQGAGLCGFSHTVDVLIRDPNERDIAFLKRLSDHLDEHVDDHCGKRGSRWNITYVGSPSCFRIRYVFDLEADARHLIHSLADQLLIFKLGYTA